MPINVNKNTKKAHSDVRCQQFQEFLNLNKLFFLLSFILNKNLDEIYTKS